MARVLVIGGTLFIGRTLVERLLARGDDVVVMHRGSGTPFGRQVGEIRCDRNDVDAVRAALGGQRFEVVYDNVYDWQHGTTGQQVAAAAGAAIEGLRRYVFTSSVAAYLEGSPRDEYDEDAPLRRSDDPNRYGAQKADSEHALFALHRERGVPVTTLRPAFIYGPNNPFDRESFFWDRILRGRPVIVPEEGERAMQWVHVDDVARAAIAATEQDAAVGRAYNLANWPPIAQADFVRLLASVAGRPVELVPVPRARIEQAGGGLSAPPFYFGVYLDLPPVTVRPERARAELGIDFTPLEEGLRETYAWYGRQRRPEPDFSWEDRLLAEAAAGAAPPTASSTGFDYRIAVSPAAAIAGGRYGFVATVVDLVHRHDDGSVERFATPLGQYHGETAAEAESRAREGVDRWIEAQQRG